MKTLTATEAARSFSEVLNRVRFRGESFVVVRGAEQVATIAPVPHSPTRFRDLVAALRAQPRRDPSWADDLESVQAAQPRIESDPWRS